MGFSLKISWYFISEAWIRGHGNITLLDSVTEMTGPPDGQKQSPSNQGWGCAEATCHNGQTAMLSVVMYKHDVRAPRPGRLWNLNTCQQYIFLTQPRQCCNPCQCELLHFSLLLWHVLLKVSMNTKQIVSQSKYLWSTFRHSSHWHSSAVCKCTHPTTSIFSSKQLYTGNNNQRTAGY